MEINKLFTRYSVANTESFFPRYNIAPSQEVPIITQDEERYILKAMRWGLVPSWAKDPSIGNKLINARAETVPEKPAFRSSFKKKRCLVPADSFYEWQKVGEGKVPQRVISRNHDIFSFAGIWDSWKKPDGSDLLSFSIITTEPNETMKPIHNRMPVILRIDDELTWLNPATTSDDLIRLLKPCSNDYLECYEVSRMVNNPRNERPEIIERVS